MSILRAVHVVSLVSLGLLLAGCGGSSGRRGGPFAGDAANATFVVEGKEVKLAGGRATLPGGADGAETEIQLTEGRLEGDLDDDGVTDLLVVVARDVAGEGATFHLAALISEEGGYRAAPAVLLGDRLVVKNLGFDGQDIKLRLVVRDPDNADPRPSKVVERRFRFVGGALQALED